MNFPGRHRRKWIFIAVGTVILLTMEHFIPFGAGARRVSAPPPAIQESAFSASPSATEVEDYQTASIAPDLPISPDAAPRYPYTEEIPAPPPAAQETPQWKKNAVPVSVPPGMAKIAIVIDDVGIDRARSAKVLALPAPVTLAFLPYAPDVAEMARHARKIGHEILVHMPMEPMNGGLDPGPVTLMESMTPDDFTKTLDGNLAALDGYVGINNHMGSRLTQDPQAMARVMAELQRRGLLFLDSRTVAQTVAAQVADRYGVPNASRDVFLDNDPSLSAVRDSLATLEKTAKHKGFAIAIGHPKDETLAALNEWLPTLAAKGFALVPVSALVHESVPPHPDTLAAAPLAAPPTRSKY